MARPYWMAGREVLDAKRPVTINIRGKHIEDAVAMNGEQCVAGRCTLQALDAQYCWFYRNVCYVAWDDDGPIYRYSNSMSLIKNVIRILDDPRRSNSEIKPGLYTLTPPRPTQRLGVNRTPKAGAKKRAKPKNAKGRSVVLGRVSAVRHLNSAHTSDQKAS